VGEGGFAGEVAEGREGGRGKRRWQREEKVAEVDDVRHFARRWVLVMVLVARRTCSG